MSVGISASKAVLALFLRAFLITRNFIKSSLIYTLAGALPMASAIILLPFYIHYLPKSVYGALSLYLAFAILVQILVSFSFESSTFVHYHEYKHDQKKLATFISSAFVFILITGAVIGCLLIVSGEILFDLIFDDPKISFYPYGVMAVATGIFQAIFKVYTNILQSSEKPMLFLRSNILQFLLIAALTVMGLYWFPETLVGPIGGRMIAGLFIAGWALYRIFTEFGLHYNYQLLRSTFGFNIYAFIHQIEQWVIAYFDRVVLLFYLSLSFVGIYDFSFKCLIAIEFVLNGMHNSFYPKVVSTITAQDIIKGTTPELNRYYHGLIALAMICVSGAILVVPFVIDALDSNKGYDEANLYVPYIAIIFILKAVRQYFAVPYGIIKYTKPLPVISLITAGLKIGLMVLLIERFGIYGVIAATILSTAVEIVALRAVLKGKFLFKFNMFKLVLAPVALIITILLIEPFFLLDKKWLLHAGYVILTGLLLLWVYRNELKLLTISKS